MEICNSSDIWFARDGRIRMQNNARGLFRLMVLAGAFLFYMGVGGDKHASALAQAAGEKIFTANCAACHAAGKNVMNPKKPIIGSEKLCSKKAFKNYLGKPTPPMPTFAKIAGSDGDLEDLYSYCKSLK